MYKYNTSIYTRTRRISDSELWPVRWSSYVHDVYVNNSAAAALTLYYYFYRSETTIYNGVGDGRRRVHVKNVLRSPIIICKAYVSSSEFFFSFCIYFFSPSVFIIIIIPRLVYPYDDQDHDELHIMPVPQCTTTTYIYIYIYTYPWYKFIIYILVRVCVYYIVQYSDGTYYMIQNYCYYYTYGIRWIREARRYDTLRIVFIIIVDVLYVRV